MKPGAWFPAIAAAVLLSVSGQATAQEFPDPATQLKQRLAAFAAPFVQEENPDATLSEWAATIVCIVEALTPLPDGVRFEMLLTEDFEDALDLAVGYVERAGLVADLERNLEACFLS